MNGRQTPPVTRVLPTRTPETRRTHSSARRTCQLTCMGSLHVKQGAAWIALMWSLPSRACGPPSGWTHIATIVGLHRSLIAASIQAARRLILSAMDSAQVYVGRTGPSTAVAVHVLVVPARQHSHRITARSAAGKSHVGSCLPTCGTHDSTTASTPASPAPPAPCGWPAAPPWPGAASVLKPHQGMC